MASLKQAPGATSPITALSNSHPGSHYVRIQNGKAVAVAWPRKRPGWKNPVNLDSRESMKALNLALKDVWYLEQVSARIWARGSAYVYRDVLTRCMMGRFIEFDLDQFMTPDDLLNQICTTPGAVIYRDNDNWVCLDPGPGGYILALDDTTGFPIWEPPPVIPPPPTSTYGLYYQVISGVTPTKANTGLTTWLNQGSGVETDSLVGLSINQPTDSGASALHGLVGSVPVAPYQVKALVSMTLLAGTFSAVRLGWYDGTNKLQVTGPQVHGSPQQYIGVDSFTNPTTFSTTNFSQQQWVQSVPIWLGLFDDGTNIGFQFSQDGDNFLTHYTVAKSAGFLGSTGYNHFFFGTMPRDTRVIGTLLDWQVAT